MSLLVCLVCSVWWLVLICCVIWMVSGVCVSILVIWIRFRCWCVVCWIGWLRCSVVVLVRLCLIVWVVMVCGRVMIWNSCVWFVWFVMYC